MFWGCFKGRDFSKSPLLCFPLPDLSCRIDTMPIQSLPGPGNWVKNSRIYIFFRKKPAFIRANELDIVPGDPVTRNLKRAPLLEIEFVLIPPDTPNTGLITLP